MIKLMFLAEAASKSACARLSEGFSKNKHINTIGGGSAVCKVSDNKVRNKVCSQVGSKG